MKKTILLFGLALIVITFAAGGYVIRAQTEQAVVKQSPDKVTVLKEVKKLLKAKVSEDVILAYLKKTQTTFNLSADEIIALKKAGATDAILKALIGETPVGAQDDFPFDLDETHQVGAPIAEGPMAVFPVYRKGPSAIESYLTLDEAIDQKVIILTEKGSSGSVPLVIIKNTGSLPIYISAGEVIIGGKQDRMVSYDVIIKPGKEMTVEVRCVEHGRWHAERSANFSSGKSMGSLKTRTAVQYKDQGEVWSEVAKENEKLSAWRSSGPVR